MSQTWNLGPVSLTAIFLLTPAYFVSSLRFGFYFLKKFRNEKMNSIQKISKQGSITFKNHFIL
ncbi:hypothetical protein LEP1GSC037_2180 [Leptospira interrogans str. 2006001854]|uniref:Uncharacterized protein n=1 Tax=Leptospira interrogans str. 2006001854 TaxID=1001590 RepID=M6GD32_LEPIR|nr:hypothetical protein LEP1GSC037_2180 [Leptospira interrogans str. 2006001854]